MSQPSIQQRFQSALDALVDEIRRDRSILAVILCGSMSHDTVWAKSDIDLVLVTIDDDKVKLAQRALYADGVNVHAFLVPRTKFRQAVEGTLRQSFLHTLLAKGKLLYTHEPSIADLHAGLAAIGERDAAAQLLGATTEALACLYKAQKWLVTRGDLEYAALWILYAATPLARIEVIGARLLADREVIPQALELNPDLFAVIYTELLNSRKTAKNVKAALAIVDDYLSQRAPELLSPVLEHLREVGEARSATEIEDHFTRNYDIEGVTTACEFLADRGLIGKASSTVQLTRKSNNLVQELAFFYIEPEAKPKRRGR